MRTVLALLFVLSIPRYALWAQQIVRTDPASGVYIVTAFNDDLEPVDLRVVPADKVRAVVTPSVERVSSTQLEYSYRTVVDPASPQELAELLVGCPAPESRFSDLHGTAGPDDTWPTSHFTYGWDDLPVCAFLGGVAPLPAGDTLEASFRTDLLPAIGEVRTVGFTEGVRWPTSDPIAENDRARAVVDSLEQEHGWRSMQSVIPAREPASLGDPASGLDIIGEDLARACGDLGWITNAGICRSLRTKLNQAARSLDRGNTRSARGQLESFTQELDAQHGEPPGKHVTDNAYWLLRTNAAYLIEHL